jgi:hypothetical protein
MSPVASRMNSWALVANGEALRAAKLPGAKPMVGGLDSI